MDVPPPKFQQSDFSPFFAAFQDFVFSSHTPPQILVTCHGQTCAFGRKTLMGVGYKKAMELFVERFARPDDFLEIHHETSTMITTARRGPTIEVKATFLHVPDRDKDNIQWGVPIDESSWGELLSNVETIDITLTKATK